MRIIGGSARGRRIAAPKGSAIRPTADRVREALFNILPRDLAGMRVLDLFAGSGSLSLEALSRGAESALLVDESAAAAKLIRRNVDALGFTDRARIWTHPVGKALSRLADEGGAYDAIFLDPPYDGGWVGKTLAAVARTGTLKAEGVAVAEHSPRERVEEQYGPLACRDRRQYGDTVLSFFGIDNEG
ncbi:MAG: 16S rRNA (guanine(966)-N(2))-methyltransferase RsmD [Deltaproteobacteria bacterium]|nr:16S rRNA (guanine(966)-N(2))-methyltransferase RsmD [Deltaproteobacteria bacterium]MDE0343247.1 16S rRNA (guanine(966)-N(2))-methyltransferase RsmD [Deltaproteobacteria bacterium]